MFVLSPSWPEPLAPQQYAMFPRVTPQVCEPMCPVLTATNVSPPDTGTGVELLTVVPFPSSPEALSPQQYAAPVRVVPQP